MTTKEGFGAYVLQGLAPRCSQASAHAEGDRPRAVAWRRSWRYGRSGAKLVERAYCQECLGRLHHRRVTADGELQELPVPTLFAARGH